MRKHLLPATLLTGAFFLSAVLSAQQADRFAYSITDVQPTGANWSFLRKLNLQNGEYSAVLLQGNDVNAAAWDASSKKPSVPMTDARFGQWVNAPFGTGVAAMAFDKKNNRLYYTPMFVDQLRYIDLKTMKVYFVNDFAFTGKPVKSSDQGNIVTRMVIASDGNGYAMTNDAMQLIRFSTGKKITVTDLGAIVDDPANKNISIHNSCSSYGGDMIADDDGNLYVFSARNNVFKINVSSKVATYLGVIEGLPAGYTVNGAAVNEDNRVLVASAAVQAPSYFTVDMKTLAAAPFALAGTVWQSSDLANSNLLASGNKKPSDPMELMRIPATDAAGAGRVSIFPNPVTGNQFTMQFGDLEPGAYTIQITDVTGRESMRQTVNVNTEMQVQQIKLNASSSKGVYLVKVLDAKGNAAFSTKIVVQ
ncbi:MAG: T9SS type A sorting domain-containing protein [Chitinophagaceae bacterium]